MCRLSQHIASKNFLPICSNRLTLEPMYCWKGGCRSISWAKTEEEVSASGSPGSIVTGALILQEGTESWRWSPYESKHPLRNVCWMWGLIHLELWTVITSYHYQWPWFLTIFVDIQTKWKIMSQKIGSSPLDIMRLILMLKLKWISWFFPEECRHYKYLHFN